MARRRARSADYFERLGDRLAGRWRAEHQDPSRFPALALAALAERPPIEHVATIDVVRDVLGGENLPLQFDPGSSFGNPPITLYRNGEFLIDLLLWVDATTAIHQHGFGGAFSVLEGSSIHSRYRFRERRRLNAHFLIGDLALDSIELLRPGDARAIPDGRAFIHALFHLERPSATIVVRTVNSPGGELQYTYYAPSVARFERPPSRRVELAGYLFEIQHRDRVALTCAALDRCHFPEAFELLDRVRPLAVPVELTRLARRVRLRHGKLAELLPAALAERTRQQFIMRRRHAVQGAEHRFFLALLLNAPRADLILALVRDRYPKRDPVDTVVGWLGELAGQPLPGGGNALGLELDPFGLELARLALRGFDGARLRRRLERDLPEFKRRRREIPALTHQLRGSLLLRTLFAKSTRPRL